MRLIDNPDTVQALKVADHEIGEMFDRLLQDTKSLGALSVRGRPGDPRLMADIAEIGDAAEEYLKAIRADVPDIRLAMMRASLMQFVPLVRSRIAEEIEGRLGRLDVIANRIGRRIGDEAPGKLTTLVDLLPVPVSGEQDHDAPPLLIPIEEKGFGRVSGKFDALSVPLYGASTKLYASTDFRLLPRGERTEISPGGKALLMCGKRSVWSASRDQEPREDGGLILIIAKERTTIHGPAMIAPEAIGESIETLSEDMEKIQADLMVHEGRMNGPVPLVSLAGTILMFTYPALCGITGLPFSGTALAAAALVTIPGWLIPFTSLMGHHMMAKARTASAKEKRLARFPPEIRSISPEKIDDLSVVNLALPRYREVPHVSA